MIVKLLTECHLEFLSLKGGCRASSVSTLVKMSNCWKSHAAANPSGSHEQPSTLDKLLGQLGIYATWLSSIAYLQKQLRIFYIFIFLRHVFDSDCIRFLIE